MDSLDTRNLASVCRAFCTVCGQPYFRTNSLTQVVCSLKCARRVPVIAKNTLKAEKKADRAKWQALKTRTDWIKDAQVAFNKYIRLRDAAKPCICCSRNLPRSGVGGAFDCGHYRSVGSAPHLRFNEFNAHGQAKQCNRYGAGRAVDYRIGLIARIGLEAVERLESDHRYHQWQIEELQGIVKEYRAKTKCLLTSS